jgi:type I restriction enzyme, R subunit
MTTEEKARKQLARHLEETGCIVQDFRQLNIPTGPGVALREFPLTTGAAD